MTAVPALFLSHGAPTLALEPGSTGPALAHWGGILRSRFPELQGVVVFSPHWMLRGGGVTADLKAPILHDFGGFPEALYRLDYPSGGSESLTTQTLNALTAAQIPTGPVAHRGLDHGAWVPLRYLFPEADLPVIQVAMPYPYDPQTCFAIGAALRDLRRSGILVIGSGGLTHNLYDYRGQPAETPPLPYVRPFADWFHEHLRSDDLSALFDYRERAPFAERAHPEADHLMPLFFARGAGGEGAALRLHHGVTHGILAMDIFAFGDAEGLLGQESSR